MTVLNKTSLAWAVLAASGFAYGHPVAAQTTYQGNDPGVGVGGARPNSDAAAASFGTAAGALGAKNTINFESAPLGFVTSLGLDSNTTLTTSNQDATFAGISNTPNTAFGYNTTTGGSKYFDFAQNFGSPGTVTFTFSTPIDAFGSYLTGTENGTGKPILLQFSDGSSQSLTVPKNPSGGGVQYFGFTDAGKSLSAVTFSEAPTSAGGTRDLFGIDDITYVKAGTVSTVPEPSTPLVLGLGSLALAGLALRARKSKAALLS